MNISIFVIFIGNRTIAEQLIFVSKHNYVGVFRVSTPIGKPGDGFSRAGGGGAWRVDCPTGHTGYPRPDTRGRAYRLKTLRVSECQVDPTYLRTCALRVRATGLAGCIRPKRMTTVSDETVTFIKISYTYKILRGDVILY